MPLPNLSNSLYVARLRYIQTLHEEPDFRNPDTLVKRFLPFLVRFKAARLNKDEIRELRNDPFYYYLLARTMHYDEIVQQSIADGVERIIGVGCGTDTRAFRFGDLIRTKGIRILECDQEAAIDTKQKMTARWDNRPNLSYMAIDLNSGHWPELERWLALEPDAKTLLMMEGVSPYIDTPQFEQFLRLLSSRLVTGSTVAYDFKLRGVKDDFGMSERTSLPFRLTSDHGVVREYHTRLGLQVEHMELGPALVRRRLAHLSAAQPLFEEDGLLRLTVGRIPGQAS